MKVSKFIILILLLLFTSQYVNAEEYALDVEGKVLEKGTRRPLSGISIFLIGKVSTSTISKPDGHFKLEINQTDKGTFSIVAVGLGYEKSESLNINITQEKFIKPIIIYLEPIPTIMGVEVTAPRNLDMTSKTVISGKELLNVAGSSGDTLRGMLSLPGIATISDWNSAPAIRGSGPNDNFYYVDFLPVGYIVHFGGVASVINSDMVDNFNLYTSAFGPEFADVTGGIIDVKLRDPRQDRIGAKLNVSMFETGILVEGPIKNNQSFYVGARRSYIDLFYPKGLSGGSTTIIQFPYFYDYQGKYIWRISDKTQLSLQFSGAEDGMTLNFLPDETAVKQDPILAGDFDAKSSYDTQGIVLLNRFSTNISNRFGIANLNSNDKLKFTQLGHAITNSNNLFIRDQMEIKTTENHLMILETEYSLIKIDTDLDITTEMPSEFDAENEYTNSPRVKNVESYNISNLAFAAKDRWRIYDKLTLIYGGRATYWDYINKYVLSPRLSTEYNLLKDTLITAGWGKYYQLPQGFEMARDFGNPKLNYFGADHYVLGIEQNIKDGWTMKVEGYYKKLYDLVIPDKQEKYINGGSGKAYGSEILLKKKETTNWSGWLSMAYTKTERKNNITGEIFPYPYDQPVVINFIHNYKFWKRWTFSVWWRFQSGAPFTPVIGTYKDISSRIRPIYGKLGSERLPDYHRLDIRFGKEWLYNTWKMSTYIQILNAYGQKNIAGYQYNSKYTSRKPITQIPFLPTLGIQAEF